MNLFLRIPLLWPVLQVRSSANASKSLGIYVLRSYRRVLSFFWMISDENLFFHCKKWIGGAFTMSVGGGISRGLASSLFFFGN